MYQVKIFQQENFQDTENLEDQVNKWLAENSGLEPVSIGMSSLGQYSARLTVLYRVIV